MAVLPKVRSALCAASQLPGEGPTDVEDAPTTVCLSKPDGALELYLFINLVQTVCSREFQNTKSDDKSDTLGCECQLKV